MKKKDYLVILKGCQVHVSALTQEQAIILAQAKAIKKGLNYELVKINDNI